MELSSEYLAVSTDPAATGEQNTRAPAGLPIALGASACGATYALAALANPACLHWFALPILVCGAFCATDVASVFLRRMDVFDPLSVFSFVGLFFFFIAPLLHVTWDTWMQDTGASVVQEWRTWIGWMGVVNAASLLCFRRVVFAVANRPVNPVRTCWTFSPRFPLVLAVALLFAVALQALFYARVGGVGGYIEAYEEQRLQAFSGMGLLFAFSERAPLLLMFGYAFYVSRTQRGKSWLALGTVLVLTLCLAMLFGGLRGSRSNTVWLMFWTVGIIHFFIRRVPLTFFVASLIPFLTFMYVMGLYKAAGRAGMLAALAGREERQGLERRTGRSVEAFLFSNMSKANIQALLLYRLTRHSREYDLALGRTYLGALCLAIPRSLWPERPPTKVKEGTEIQYGRGSYRPGMVSSKTYALGGEAMLNFGWVGVPIVFGVFGSLVGRIRRFLLGLPPGDIRWLIAPFLVTLCVTLAVGDSDNNVFFIVKNGVFPFIVLYIGRSSYRYVLPNSGTGYNDGA